MGEKSCQWQKRDDDLVPFEKKDLPTEAPEHCFGQYSSASKCSIPETNLRASASFNHTYSSSQKNWKSPKFNGQKKTNAKSVHVPKLKKALENNYAVDYELIHLKRFPNVFRRFRIQKKNQFFISLDIYQPEILQGSGLINIQKQKKFWISENSIARTLRGKHIETFPSKGKFTKSWGRG